MENSVINNKDNSFENNDIYPYLNKYPSLSDLSIDDYSASKPLSYDSDLDREYAMVNRTSPEEHSYSSHCCHDFEVMKCETDYSVGEETIKSCCTSLFESDNKPTNRRTPLNKFSRSFSISYRSPNQNLSLHQLLGKYI